MGNQEVLVTGYEIAILTVLNSHSEGLTVTEIVKQLDGRLEASSASKTCQRMNDKGLIHKARVQPQHDAGPGRPKVIYVVSESGKRTLKYWTLRDDM